MSTTLADHAIVLRDVAYGSLGLASASGMMTYLNENASGIGLLFSIGFGLLGVGFAVANLKLNRRRLEMMGGKKPPDPPPTED